MGVFSEHSVVNRIWHRTVCFCNCVCCCAVEWLSSIVRTSPVSYSCLMSVMNHSPAQL